MRKSSNAFAIATAVGLAVLPACGVADRSERAEIGAAYVPAYEERAQIIVLNADLAADILLTGAGVERLTDDLFQWSEGPVWVQDGGYLLFTDVPTNTMFKWSEAGGLETFLKPAGYGGEDPDGIFGQPGANGLIPGDQPGTILLADHGNRAIARLNLASKEKTFLATDHDGKKFSSPNDLVLAADGSVYFTDPPYGLAGLNASPHKEADFNGVYRWHPGGRVDLIDDSLTMPNGIILSPDGWTLYVAVSDPEAAQLFAYDLDAEGNPTGRRMLADLTPMVAEGYPGLPDGMAMDTAGRVYLAGPGGVSVFMPDGTPVLRIDTGTAAANCTFGDDGRTLYITSGPWLGRVRLSAAGLGF
ncbi:SMP-30/gluconolactonase/LRE family protein [Hyphomonas sp.]|uniref:SMP-30/gluconolactonase/LRE family protein n=1 Tax=Hyphomonas sp. TaxID=87 RepID=UPI00391AB28B